MLLAVHEKAQQKFALKVYGLCLMANHVHLLTRPMGRKSKRKILGTSGSDELTGKKGNLIWGDKGNDRIDSGEGKDKAWGGEGDDTIVTIQGKVFVKVMDMQIGDKIEFCGCTSTVIQMKGDDAWIRNGSDVYAVVKGSMQIYSSWISPTGRFR